MVWTASAKYNLIFDFSSQYTLVDSLGENMEDFVKRLYYVAACQYATFDRVFRGMVAH